MSKRIDETAYELQLPSYSKIHNVFHVSLLKKAYGDSIPTMDLPKDSIQGCPLLTPLSILSTKVIMRQCASIQQVLV